MLKKIRKKYNLRQRDLAALLNNINRSYVALIETERRNLPKWVVERLCELFGDEVVEQNN